MCQQLICYPLHCPRLTCHISPFSSQTCLTALWQSNKHGKYGIFMSIYDQPSTFTTIILCYNFGTIYTPYISISIITPGWCVTVNWYCSKLRLHIDSYDFVSFNLCRHTGYNAQSACTGNIHPFRQQWNASIFIGRNISIPHCIFQNKTLISLCWNSLVWTYYVRIIGD